MISALMSVAHGGQSILLQAILMLHFMFSLCFSVVFVFWPFLRSSLSFYYLRYITMWALSYISYTGGLAPIINLGSSLTVLGKRFSVFT
jgi:hypothetical protein